MNILLLITLVDILIWFTISIGTLTLITYLFTFSQKKTFIISKKLGVRETCNLYYYLPTYRLKIKAIAKVKIYYNSKTKEIKGEPISQTFEVESEIIADINNAFALEYHSSNWAHDIIKFEISEKGLLQTSNVTTEDAIPKIIAQISEAATINLEVTKNATESIPASDNSIEEKIEIFEQIFFVDNKSTNKTEWRQIILSKDGLSSTNIDLGFSTHKITTVQDEIGQAKSIDVSDVTFDGILTRPVINTNFNIISGNSNLKDSTFDFYITVPSQNRIVQVNIERKKFIKQTYDMTLKNGMLTSVSIDKPSEAKGFASVPINIIKTIVSIPSAMLNFKIGRLEDDKKYISKLNILELEKLKSEIAAQNRNLEMTKALEKLKNEIRTNKK